MTPNRNTPSGQTSPPARRVPLVALLVGAVVVLALIALVVSRGGGSDDEAAPVDTSAPSVEFGSPSVTGDALPEFTGAPDDAGVGRAIPTVAGQSPTGADEAITTGSPQVLVFLAHWCPHCNKEADSLKAEIDGGLDPSGIRLVLTGSSPNQPNWPPSLWLESKGLGDLPTIVDDSNSSIGRAYGLTSFPFIVGVDAAGRVTFRAAGEQATGFFAQALGGLRG
jgi:hypothetical protein